MWYYCKHCSTYNWLFLFGTCPADCPLDGNATTNRPTVSTAVASGNIVGDLVTLLIYFIFTFGMGGGGLKMFLLRLLYLSVCVPVEIPEWTKEFSRDLCLILASLIM